jgi:hypothetical protein
VLTGRAAPARVGAAILRKPVTRAVRRLSRFSWSEARTQHSLELLASQMRRVVAEAAKSYGQHTAEHQGQAEQQHWQRD